MQTITLDLKKLPDVANFLTDKEPGDPVYLCGTIKSLDDATCVVTVEEIEDREEKDEGASDNADEENLEEEQKPIGEGAEPKMMGDESADTMRDVAPGEKAAY